MRRSPVISSSFLKSSLISKDGANSLSPSTILPGVADYTGAEPFGSSRFSTPSKKSRKAKKRQYDMSDIDDIVDTSPDSASKTLPQVSLFTPSSLITPVRPPVSTPPTREVKISPSNTFPHSLSPSHRTPVSPGFSLTFSDPFSSLQNSSIRTQPSSYNRKITSLSTYVTPSNIVSTSPTFRENAKSTPRSPVRQAEISMLSRRLSELSQQISIDKTRFGLWLANMEQAESELEKEEVKKKQQQDDQKQQQFFLHQLDSTHRTITLDASLDEDSDDNEFDNDDTLEVSNRSKKRKAQSDTVTPLSQNYGIVSFTPLNKTPDRRTGVLPLTDSSVSITSPRHIIKLETHSRTQSGNDSFDSTFDSLVQTLPETETQVSSPDGNQPKTELALPITTSDAQSENSQILLKPTPNKSPLTSSKPSLASDYIKPPPDDVLSSQDIDITFNDDSSKHKEILEQSRLQTEPFPLFTQSLVAVRIASQKKADQRTEENQNTASDKNIPMEPTSVTSSPVSSSLSSKPFLHFPSTPASSRALPSPSSIPRSGPLITGGLPFLFQETVDKADLQPSLLLFVDNIYQEGIFFSATCHVLPLTAENRRKVIQHRAKHDSEESGGNGEQSAEDPTPVASDSLPSSTWLDDTFGSHFDVDAFFSTRDMSFSLSHGMFILCHPPWTLVPLPHADRPLLFPTFFVHPIYSARITNNVDILLEILQREENQDQPISDDSQLRSSHSFSPIIFRKTQLSPMHSHQPTPTESSYPVFDPLATQCVSAAEQQRLLSLMPQSIS